MRNFKGSTEIDCDRTFPPKKIALAKVEIAYAAYDAEYRKRVGQSPAKLAELLKVFQDAEAAAQKYVIPINSSAIARKRTARWASTPIDCRRLRAVFAASHAIQPA